METWFMPSIATPLPPARNVLVLAPHPDDEVFGCGGSVALYAQTGVKVQPYILTDGGGYLTGTERNAAVALRRKESCRAAQILGTAAPTFGPWQDRQLSTAENLTGHLSALIQATAPDVVLAPSLWEIHPDHRATAWAAIRAVSETYQVRGSAPLLAFYEVGAPLRPSHLIDISAVLGLKRQAMGTFVSQLTHQRYDVHIAALNTFRTYSLAGDVAAAEAFILVENHQLDNWQLAYAQAESPGLAQLTEAALQNATGAAEVLGQTLRSQTQRLDEQAKELAKTANEWQGARTELEVAKLENHTLAQRLTEISASLEVAKLENHTLAQRLAEIFASRSWRVTRPLRWLGERLRNHHPGTAKH
jgi:LmbE family N-acetylglucosaminyl deacetylase